MQGLEAFLATFAFVGVLTGTAAGAAAAWFSWPRVRSFAVALALVAIAMLLHDLPADVGFGGALAALLLMPLVAALPVGAGFVVGYRFVEQRREKD